MKNYYDLLQVNKNASKEIIKNAYKILSKEQGLSQEVKKDLEEAYNVLSDDFLREQYNKEYEKEYNDSLRKEMYQANVKQEVNKKTHIKQNTKKIKNNEGTEKKEKEHRIGSFMSLVDILKDIFSTIKNGDYKKTTTNWNKKDSIALIAAVVIVVMIGIALWFIPFTHEWIKNFIFIW